MEFDKAIKELQNEFDSPILGADFELNKSDKNEAKKTGNGFSLQFSRDVYAFRLIYQLLEGRSEVSFSPRFDGLSFMVDVARNNAPKVKTFKRLIRHLALFGYSALKIYLEDCFEVEGEPYFGYLRPRYSKKELREIVEYAKIFGIEVVPCIETLAHMKTLQKWCVYRYHFDIDDILLVDDPRIQTLLRNEFKTLREVFSTDRINIGFDEAMRIGRGRYYELHGLHSPKDIMLRQLDFLTGLADEFGFKIEMWGDMFLNESFDSSDLQKKYSGLKLIDWDYEVRDVDEFASTLDAYLKISPNIAVAGGAWRWIGYAPNNRYSILHLERFFKAATQKGIKEFTLTAWGDNGAECSLFAILPSIDFLANLNYGWASSKKAFRELTGYSQEEFLALDLPNATEIPYAAEHKNSLSRLFALDDLMLGIYDSCIPENQTKLYQHAYNQLAPLALRDSRYSYLFATMRDFVGYLEVKVPMGLELRKAYHEGNLADCLPKLRALSKALECFYDSFYNQWMREAKGIGFEVQDIRLGAVARRIRTTEKRIGDYLEGYIKDIDELEMGILDFYGNVDDFFKPKDLVDCRYSMMGSANLND